MKKITGVLILLAIVAAFLIAAVFASSNMKIIDMTYPFDENSIYWPSGEPFALKKVFWGVGRNGMWCAFNDYAASEHIGTHVDAPIHFAKDGKTIDKVPLEEWIGPAVKIDVTEKCAQNRDYILTVNDIENWEKKYGRVPVGAWVIMYTGIDTKFYPDRKKIFGTDGNGKEAFDKLSFPGFSPEAAEFLIKNRNITGVGLDTPSTDFGKSKNFMVHRIICGAGKLGLENIANLDKLPAKGATLYVVPMFIKDGTGAPARVFAILPYLN